MFRLFNTTQLIVYGFCRSCDLTPKIMIDDLINIVFKYYDCDELDQTFLSKDLRIIKDNCSMIQVKNTADQRDLQFCFGKKTILIDINCYKNIKHNIIQNPNGLRSSQSTQCRWKIKIGGRSYKKLSSKKHVCCGIGIMHIDDICSPVW